MKITKRIISVLLLVCMLLPTFAACQDPEPEITDHAGAITLDMTSETAKTTATVDIYIDGDTTHFHVPTEVVANGILKARYIAVNTPESTGKIEPWGNDAANFTKSKLENAVSIILESDTATWNIDSTGERRVVWVWYKTAEDAEYRNLNIEILQNGLAFASNSEGNRYGEMCKKALEYAKANQSYVWGTALDPDFPYGDPVPTPLRDIRLNIKDYYYHNVYFEGVVVKDDGGTIYVESYDEESGMCFGITAYYATSGLKGEGLTYIQVGSKVRLVGVITYFEAGDIWQLSDLYYNSREPDDPRCLEFIGNGYWPTYTEVTVEEFFADKTITVDGKGVTKPYCELAMNTSISMKDLEVVSVYTTNNGGDSDGAMTLTCKQNGKTIEIRTLVLKDANGNLVTADYFRGKTIDVLGTVDQYQGDYQIQLFSIDDVVIH